MRISIRHIVLPLLLVANACEASEQSAASQASATSIGSSGSVVHDAEYYVLERQHAEQWAADDAEVDKRLAEIREANGGKPPNILYILIDDIGFGEIGEPYLNYVRGYETPSINDRVLGGSRYGGYAGIPV